MSSPDFSHLDVDKKRELLKKMLQEKKEKEHAGNFENKELKQTRKQVEYFASLGIENPYTRIIEGVSRDVASIAGKEYINFSGYNYLGCNGDPFINQAVIKAVEQYGTSASASRVVSGTKPIHVELENRLAKNLECEAAICFVGGFTTNASTLGHLMNSEDLILLDSLAHRSLITGAQLSGARRIMFKHNDLEDLESKCKEFRHSYKKCLIVIEGVYSMDGDIPDLPKYIQIKNKYQSMLMVDEAHSMGVLGKTGKGIREYFGVSGNEVDIWMGTLSKSYATCGGYIGGSQGLIDNLRYTCPGYVYSVGLPPPAAAAALASIELIEKEPQRLKQLHAMADLFRQESKKYNLDTGLSHDSSVVPIITHHSLGALLLSDRLFKQGINAQPILYPTVEENVARVRFFITSLHTEMQILKTVQAVAQIMEDIQNDPDVGGSIP